MSENELVKNIVNGGYTSGELTTELADLETKWDFIRAINSPFYTRILFEDSSAANVVYNSVTAKDLILNSSTALVGISSSFLATKNTFNNSVIAKEILENKGFYSIFRSNAQAYQNLKACVNTTKLKRSVFLADSALARPAGGFAAMAYCGIGRGGTNTGSGASSYCGGGGEVKVAHDIDRNEALIITIASGANTITMPGLTTFTVAGTTGATGVGSDTQGGLEALNDRNFLNAAWQFDDFSARGEDGKAFDNGDITTFPKVKAKAGGDKGFLTYGAGAIPTSPGTPGLIVVYYLEN